MLPSRAAEAALRALPLLDPRGPSAPGVLVRELAERARLPEPFLAKVLQRLAQAGVLRSRKGRAGGFVLGRPAAEITLADVVLALEGRDDLGKVYPPAGGTVGQRLAPVRDRLFSLLSTTTIADLLSPRPDSGPESATEAEG